MLRVAGVSEPVQARDLFDLSTAVSQAWHATGGRQSRETAISYAAYRLLVWRASYGANLDRSFDLLSARLRSLCLSPDFTRATGGSAAELGNRIGAAAIAAGRSDGSNEPLHYADPSYTPVNEPLVVATGVSTVHDATFWQPLALSQKSAQGGGSVPANVQTFENSQWGHVRTFAARVTAGAPGLGDSSSAAFKQAAVAAIRATSQAGARPVVDGVAARLEPRRCGAAGRDRSAAARLARDVRLDLALNAALNDAAVSAWGAKRAYQAPRPISMIRYLAFNNQLPLVPGLIKRVGSQQLVLRAGRWVPGVHWSPLAPTPPSPGWVSGDSAFAYAAGEVLTAFTGRSVRRAGRPGRDAGRRPRHRAPGRRHGRPCRSARRSVGSCCASSRAERCGYAAAAARSSSAISSFFIFSIACHGPPGLVGIRVAQKLLQTRRDDLPGDAVAVGDPAAGDLLAVLREPRPVPVQLVLRLARDHERDPDTADLVLRAAVEADERASQHLEAHGHHRPRLARPGLAVVRDVGDARVREDGGVELRGLFGLRVEPQPGRELLHGEPLSIACSTIDRLGEPESSPPAVRSLGISFARLPLVRPPRHTRPGVRLPHGLTAAGRGV